MGTPWEARKLAMAIPYRDGITFYAGTFSITLAVLATWHFASRVYIGVTVYAPWIAFQIAISWILLDFRTSQVFERASHQRQAHIQYVQIKTTECSTSNWTPSDGPHSSKSEGSTGRNNEPNAKCDRITIACRLPTTCGTFAEAR